MAFVVETGAVVANANSFVSLEYADAYFVDRPNTVWLALSNAAKEQALIKATDYIELRWGSRLSGNAFTTTQALLFPRVYSYNGAAMVPVGVMRATCEYAVRAATAPLAPDFTTDTNGRLAVKVVEEIGPIREEVVYAAGTNGGAVLPPSFRVYPVPDNMMKMFINNSSGQLVRA